MKHLLAAATVIFLLSYAAFSQQSDAALRSVIEKDKTSRDHVGKLLTLPAAEHLARGTAYFTNRLFPQSREHLQQIIDNYPSDAGIPAALFMVGRSYMWERQYAVAIPYLNRVSREFPATKDGREGLAFDGACHVRLGKNDEAAKIYEQYTVLYPNGERIDGAYLNIIDALREAGKYDEADKWVDKTSQRFAGMPTQTNALHARLRMQIYRQNWNDAVKTSDDLLRIGNFTGAMTGSDEVKFLKAAALEGAGHKAMAAPVYYSIRDDAASVYDAPHAHNI